RRRRSLPAGRESGHSARAVQLVAACETLYPAPRNTGRIVSNDTNAEYNHADGFSCTAMQRVVQSEFTQAAQTGRLSGARGCCGMVMITMWPDAPRAGSGLDLHKR